MRTWGQIHNYSAVSDAPCGAEEVGGCLRTRTCLHSGPVFPGCSTGTASVEAGLEAGGLLSSELQGQARGHVCSWEGPTWELSGPPPNLRVSSVTLEGMRGATSPRFALVCRGSEGPMCFPFLAGRSCCPGPVCPEDTSVEM